jgi:hypothetical protein
MAFAFENLLVYPPLVYDRFIAVDSLIGISL